MAEKVRMLDLQVFVTLVKEKSFSRTGIKIGMTQSSITQLVQKIEEFMGSKLVARSSKSFTLTRTGRIFHDTARDILERFAACRRDIESTEVETRNKLHVAVSTTPGEFIFPRFFSEFGRIHPGIRLVIEMVDSKRAVDLLLDKECQVAIVGGMTGSLDDTHEKVILLQEPLDVIVSNAVDAPEGVVSLDTLSRLARVDRESGSGTRDESESFLEAISARVKELHPDHVPRTVQLQSVQAILTAVADSDDTYAVIGHFPAARYAGLGLVKKVFIEGFDFTPSRFIMLLFNKYDVNENIRVFKDEIEKFCYIRSLV